MQKNFYVYILTNKYNQVFYIGITNNLLRRLREHKHSKTYFSYTQAYNIFKLVYFENYNNPKEAIAREKKLKNWKREWKISLVKEENPYFRDLSLDWDE